MRFLKLRIAWSVVWGSVAVLLVAMWVRSYGREGILYRNLKRLQITVQSSEGFFSFVYFQPKYSFDPATNLYKRRNGYVIERMPQWLVSRGLSFSISDPRDHYRSDPFHTKAVLAFFPPHSANHDNASGRGAGVGRVVDSAITFPLWRAF
jgi:hypothetical protein